jgi:plasmid stability protein
VRWENQRDNHKDRYELEAQSKQVAGAAERKARARSPSINYGLPDCVLPNKAPVSDEPEPMPGPGQSLQKQLHASMSSRVAFGKINGINGDTIRAMAMTLRLTDDETNALRERAGREGRSMQDVARSAVREYIDRTSRRELLDDVLDQELPRYAEALRRLGE